MMGSDRMVGIAALALLLAAAVSVPAVAGQPTVETSQGKLTGSVEGGVRRFLGIPYAKPPVGDLRFRAPVPAGPWQGVLEATSFGAECMQWRFGGILPWLVGEEDCLHLNVYRPDSDARDLPVLVWIHGGGRRIGNNRRDVTDFVRDTNTVVVTISYRLDHMAIFAHPALTSEDPERPASGNYGFQDAMLALRWVRREIERFGGDASRVTIGGLSGGGTMVCGLLVSPQAAGLFDGAIIQSSGGCWFPTEPMSLAEARGVETASFLFCSGSEDVPGCLRSRPAWAYFLRGSTVPNPFRIFTSEYAAAAPIRGGSSGHTVDGHVFPESWPDSFRAGSFHRVPVMIGVTEHEGRWIYGHLLMMLGGYEFDAENYVAALHGLMGTRELAEQVAKDFPLGTDSRSAAEVFADLGTAAHYTCPHAELAHAMAPYTNTWLYEFRVPGPQEDSKLELGAYHGADTELLFGGGFRGPIPPLNEEQQQAAATLRRYVANFVSTGSPNGKGLADWPVHKESTGEQHLVFDADPAAGQGLRQSACRYWRRIDWYMLPRAAESEE